MSQPKRFDNNAPGHVLGGFGGGQEGWERSRLVLAACPSRGQIVSLTGSA